MQSSSRFCLSAIAILLSAAWSTPARAEDASPAEKPKVAIFPLTGTADADLRTRVGFSMRMKLDRDGAYEAIDGPTMDDDAEDAKSPITFDTGANVIKPLAAQEKPVILIWGDLNTREGMLGHLRLKIWDLRQESGIPRAVEKDIHEQTDVRFIVEEILKTLPGVKDFEHPDEEAVHHDAQSDALWEKNPNLVVDGDFTTEGHWQLIYQSRIEPVKFSAQLPGEDQAVIDRQAEEPNTLAMKLSQTAAENNGLGCLSDAIAIKAGVKYRIAFKYKSDGPVLHVFVKGYTHGKDLAGKPELREVYRRQVSPSGATSGGWVTVECDMNPQNVDAPVEFLKVDLYAYLKPGLVEFRDVELKVAGRQAGADEMRDPGIQSRTRPSE